MSTVPWCHLWVCEPQLWSLEFQTDHHLLNEHHAVLKKTWNLRLRNSSGKGLSVRVISVLSQELAIIVNPVEETHIQVDICLICIIQIIWKCLVGSLQKSTKYCFNHKPVIYSKLSILFQPDSEAAFHSLTWIKFHYLLLKGQTFSRSIMQFLHFST